VQTRTGGGTDCPIPLQDAMMRSSPYDGIVTYTDNENGGGSVCRWLDGYRAQRNRAAKFATVALAAHECSLARPEDTESLDIVGCDATAPEVPGACLADQCGVLRAGRWSWGILCWTEEHPTPALHPLFAQG
jgi:hypothetical protein